MHTVFPRFLLLFLFALPFICCPCSVQAANRPNIVLIMADDMGYTDIGCYGSEIETPVLDRLAGNGLRFTQFYNTSRCCPTRASLLTGLYSHQAGIGLMTGDRGYEAYRGDLNRRCVTLAESLGLAGYQNYMSGNGTSRGTRVPRLINQTGHCSEGLIGSTAPSPGQAAFLILPLCAEEISTSHLSMIRSINQKVFITPTRSAIMRPTSCLII